MKKFLLAVALGLISGVAAEAGAFSDLPADHWAYRAIEDLADRGMIKGFPDKAFRGSKNVTRYEMALVVARLLAEQERREEFIGANDVKLIDRITMEFSDELIMMGYKVRNFESDMLAVKEEVANLKSEVSSLANTVYNTDYDKVRISGDMLVSHYDYNEKNSTHGEHRAESIIRLRLDSALSDIVSIGGVWRLLDDRRNGAGLASSQWNGRNKGTGDVEALYLNIDNPFGRDGFLKIGRDWFSHGHGLVVHNYMDAISYTKNVGNVELSLNCFFDRGNSIDDEDYRNIWNLNADYRYKEHKIYFGAYYNKRDFKGSLNKNSVEAVRSDSQKDLIVEFGLSGKLTKDRKFSYDVAYVRDLHENSITSHDINGNIILDVDGNPRTSKEKGWLYFAGIGYDNQKGFSAKVHYLYADDESHHSISREDANRWHMGEESLYEDIYWLNNFGMNGDNVMNLKNTKLQLSYTLKNNNKHSFRLAYDNLRSTGTKINGMYCPRVMLDMYTFEYCYKLACNSRIRVGYHHAKDKDGGIVRYGSNAVPQTQDHNTQSLLFVELYSRF